MDPIQPIEPRSRWISELAPPQAQSASRERRKTSPDGDRKREPRRESREAHGPEDDRHIGDRPEDDRPDGRHIDVRV
jgi:hypothetical protein